MEENVQIYHKSIRIMIQFKFLLSGFCHGFIANANMEIICSCVCFFHTNSDSGL